MVVRVVLHFHVLNIESFCIVLGLFQMFISWYCTFTSDFGSCCWSWAPKMKLRLLCLWSYTESMPYFFIMYLYLILSCVFHFWINTACLAREVQLLFLKSYLTIWISRKVLDYKLTSLSWHDACYYWSFAFYCVPIMINEETFV